MKKPWIWVAAVAVAIAASGVGFVVFAGENARESGEYQKISFALLSSYPYTPPVRKNGVPDTDRPDPFPAAVKAFNGLKVSIKGFMVPLSMKEGRIDSFYLSRGGNMGCCYGDMPRINDYIMVTMAPNQYAPNADLALVSGVLEVGEQFETGGFVSTVYRLRADLVRGEKNEEPVWVNIVIWVVAGLFFAALFGPAGTRLVKAALARARQTRQNVRIVG